MSSSGTKLDLKYVDKIAEDAKQYVKNTYRAIADLEKALKTCATGNEGHSYWSGRRAIVWYASTVRRIANSYYRLSQFAKVYEAMCETAAKTAYNDSGRNLYDKLSDSKDFYKDMQTDCRNGYANILKWGRS